jgi:hypothetical protein
MEQDNKEFKIEIDEVLPVSIESMHVEQLDALLEEELIYSDIKEFQDGIFKEIKKIKPGCDCSCKLRTIVLKEVIIVRRLLEWIDILSEECQSKEN